MVTPHFPSWMSQTTRSRFQGYGRWDRAWCQCWFPTYHCFKSRSLRMVVEEDHHHWLLAPSPLRISTLSQQAHVKLRCCFPLGSTSGGDNKNTNAAKKRSKTVIKLGSHKTASCWTNAMLWWFWAPRKQELKCKGKGLKSHKLEVVEARQLRPWKEIIPENLWTPSRIVVYCIYFLFRMFFEKSIA